MNIAVLGTGMMGKTHLEIYQRLSDVNVKAVFSRALERAAELAQSCEAVPLADWRQAVSRADIDAVDICLPIACHSEVIDVALRAGKHVLCETPMLRSASEGEKLISLAREENKLLGVALLTPWVSKFQWIKDRVLSGELGKVIGGSACCMSAPYVRPGEDGHHGDALVELGTFDLVALHLLFGAPSTVHAARFPDPRGVCDHVSSLLEYADGHLFELHVSSKLPAGFPYRSDLRILCERGALELSFLLPGSGAPISVLSGEAAKGKVVQEVADKDHYTEELRHFAACVNEGLPLGPMHADIAVQSAHVERAIRSAVARKAVDTPELASISEHA